MKTIKFLGLIAIFFSLNCQQENTVNSFVFLHQADISKLSQNANTIHIKNDMDQIAKNFNRSCGVAFHKFIPHLKKQAQKAKVPASVLVGILTKESSGRCNLSAHHDGARGSYGLFQIALHSKTPKPCTKVQLKRVQNSKTLAALKNGPKCLHNPVVGLNEAIKNLNANLELVQQEFPKADYWDTWRLVTSSYNGGFEWVRRAKYDLIDFTQKHDFNLKNSQVELDFNRFNDLVPFYLKHKTAKKGQISKFYTDLRTSRSLKMARLNLTYVYQVLGAEGTPLIEQEWQSVL